MRRKIEELIEHAGRNEGAIKPLFDELRACAKRQSEGVKSEVAGRDGLRFAIGRVRFCELHPRPFARPPYVGLWLPFDDETTRSLRHQQTRKGWHAVRRQDELPKARHVIELAAASAKARQQ